ncbi:hypothetical protein SAMN04487928_10624 [Butyrivibrio proteoclasticus]|uniref:Uncharacterized protein n=1 Tax=Butyrivibrio proteoclasticus TaxID=43305 RepID=A0A1I5SDE4_9FIRM|nr:hypothetical protein SAMN04487928_10624 [Butyrivibrio proteoclasticus]
MKVEAYESSENMIRYDCKLYNWILSQSQVLIIMTANIESGLRNELKN